MVWFILGALFCGALAFYPLYRLYYILKIVRSDNLYRATIARVDNRKGEDAHERKQRHREHYYRQKQHYMEMFYTSVLYHVYLDDGSYTNARSQTRHNNRTLEQVSDYVRVYYSEKVPFVCVEEPFSSPKKFMAMLALCVIGCVAFAVLYAFSA